MDTCVRHPAICGVDLALWAAATLPCRADEAQPQRRGQAPEGTCQHIWPEGCAQAWKSRPSICAWMADMQYQVAMQLGALHHGIPAIQGTAVSAQHWRKLSMLQGMGTSTTMATRVARGCHQKARCIRKFPCSLSGAGCCSAVHASAAASIAVPS